MDRSAELSRAAAEAALLAGDAARACRIAEALATGRGEAYWLRLRAFCQAEAGQGAQAQLTFDLAQTQARVMLGGALSYIGETARLGWDDPATPEHEEAYGWIDVRDGSVGPRDHTGRALFQAEINPDLGKGERWPAIGSRS